MVSLDVEEGFRVVRYEGSRSHLGGGGTVGRWRSIAERVYITCCVVMVVGVVVEFVLLRM